MEFNTKGTRIMLERFAVECRQHADVRIAEYPDKASAADDPVCAVLSKLGEDVAAATTNVEMLLTAETAKAAKEAADGG